MLKTVSTQLALASDTLPEVLAKGNTTGGTDLAVSAGDDITLADNSKVIFGAGSDLSIYSDGSTGQVTGNVNVTGVATVSENVGLGIAPSAWGGVFRSLDISGSAISSTAGGAFVASGNCYFNGSQWVYKNTGFATRVELNAGSSGAVLYTAPSGLAGAAVSFNQSMSLDASGNLSTAGNVVLASGKGIDFSATPGTGTSELLDDYEEGVWTPADNSGGGLSFTVTAAAYTKIGRTVFASFDITYPVTSDTNYAGLTGLPFVSKNSGTVAIAVTNSSTLTYAQTGASDDVIITLYDNTGGLIQNNTLSGKVIRATAIYYSA